MPECYKLKKVTTLKCWLVMAVGDKHLNVLSAKSSPKLNVGYLGWLGPTSD